MDKIREGISHLQVYMPAGLPKHFVGTDLADQILTFLKENNVKIVGEIKMPVYKAGRAVDTWIAIERLWYEKGRQDTLKAHYDSLKELI